MLLASYHYTLSLGPETVVSCTRYHLACVGQVMGGRTLWHVGELPNGNDVLLEVNLMVMGVTVLEAVTCPCSKHAPLP